MLWLVMGMHVVKVHVVKVHVVKVHVVKVYVVFGQGACVCVFLFSLLCCLML